MIIIQNGSFFFLIFEEIHATIGLIRKHLEHLVGLLGAQQNQGEVRQYHGFLEPETFWLLFCCCLFQKVLLLIFNVNY